MDKVGEVVSKARAVAPGQVLVVGKCLRVRRYEKNIYTVIICPARDEYSRPAVVEVRSNARFSEPEEKVSVLCELGGYEGKSYSVTDRETGERKNLVPVHLHLTLVE